MGVKNYSVQFSSRDVLETIINNPPSEKGVCIYAFDPSTTNIPDVSGWWSVLAYRMSNNYILLATNTWNGRFASARVLDNGTESEIVWRIANYIP